MTLAQIKKNIKHGDYSILQKLLRLSTESAARQKFLRGDKDAVEGMIKIQENRSIFCDLHADEDCSCHDDLKEAINQKADINHTHDWNEITGKPNEFPPTHHSHDVRDIEGLDYVLHTIDDIRNLSNQKLDRDGSNATGALASTINNNHNHVNKAVLDTITASKVNDWDNAAGKAHNAVTLGSNAAGLTITNQVLQFSNGYQLPTTIKISEWDDAYLKRHTHGNKTVLDNLTQSVIDQSHAHSNKSVIDGITAQMVNNWNGSFANNHTHNNKSTLDGISSADVTNWDTAHANNHTHANKVILDAITAAYTVAEKNKLTTVQPNAQVNVKADWNATSGDAEILNKPNSFIPDLHNHAISDVAGLQSELDSKLETPHLNGFVHDVTYNSSLHTLTFYQRNEPNIVIDLPIEHLIKGVQLHGNDLVFTFEDGSNVTVPMNTLLVGVVKSVNGLTANSQGEVVLNIADIPGLQNTLNGKANTSGYYSSLHVGQTDNSEKWNELSFDDTFVNTGTYFMTSSGGGTWRYTDISSMQNILGINTALNLNLQQVSTNGNTTTIPLIVKGTTFSDEIWNNNPIPFLTNQGEAQKIYTGGLLVSDSYSDANLIPVNGIYAKGTITTLNHHTSLEWATAYNIAINVQNNKVDRAGDSMTGTLYAPQLITDLSYLSPGIVPTNTGFKLWQGSGNSQYGITVNANSGGMDIMANQNGQGIRFWSSTDNSNPTLSAAFNGGTAAFSDLVTATKFSTGGIALGDLPNLLRMTRQGSDLVGFLSDSNGWADVQGKIIYSNGHGNSVEWNNTTLNALQYKGQQISNSDANALSSGIWFNTTGNGTGNTNWATAYGTLIQFPSAGAFVPRFFINHDGETTIRSEWQGVFRPDRRLWDNINLPEASVSALLSMNSNPTWDDVLGNSTITGHLPVFNRGQGGKFIMKSQSAVGENYHAYQNNSGQETHYIGLGGTSNNHFAFYSHGDNQWNFYTNGNHIVQIQNNYIEMYRDLYISSGSTINTSLHGNSADWWDAKVNSFRHDYAGGLNNASNGRTNQSFFDYNWANTNVSGVVASFDGLNPTYRTEIFGEYTNGGNRFGVRTLNGDINQWNTSKWLWHDGNLSDPATETWVNNNFIASSQLGNYALTDGSNTTGGINWDIQRIMSSDLSGISGNGQIFYQSGNQIYWGNPLLTMHNFEMSNNNGLTVYSSQSGSTGQIWHQFNFDPSLKANYDGSNLTNIANWRSILGVPTNNNQLSNGAGYITSNALNGYASQSWVNSQGFLTSASLPNVSNATITYQGTGAITGGGSHTINQSGNSTYNFDLTNQTKNQISLGVNAYNSLSSKQDTLVAGSGISIIGNTISATNGGGGSGIERIFTDNSQQPGSTASQVPLTFTSHEAYGKPEADNRDDEHGNLTMKVETGDVVRWHGSFDSTYTDTPSVGTTYHIDIDGLRRHIYNIIFQNQGSGGTGGTVRFDKGIYEGDQINITVPRGQQINIQASTGIISSFGSEVQTHANLIWSTREQQWVLVSYN